MEDLFNYNYEKIANGIINWVKRYFGMPENIGRTAVVGISGGKDSTITAKLLVEALGKERVYGVMLPCGIQKDIEDSYAVCDYLGIEPHCINIKNSVDVEFQDLTNHGFIVNSTVRTNAPARIRMTKLYSIAASLPKGGRVSNTSNLTESSLGWDTKYGDNVGDFALLQDFVVNELYKLGISLGIPERFVLKTPEDGMCGKSDEEVFGFKYLDADKVIRRIPLDSSSLLACNKIENMIKASGHKRNINIPGFAFLPSIYTK